MLPDWAIGAGVVLVCCVLIGILRGSGLLIKNLRVLHNIYQFPDNEILGQPPFVSVIIPAKDEEDFIADSVHSVLDSHYTNMELIVVDDRSIDRTGNICSAISQSDSRMKVLTIRDLPEGWTGKTHALYRGVEKASGEILLFIDADTVITNDVIGRAVGYLLRNNLGMLGLLPSFKDPGWIEKVVYPHLALGISFLNPLSEVNNPDSTAGIASGSFIMITRHAYHAVGTWERFRQEITEDIALSRVIKKCKLGLQVLMGYDAVRTRSFNGLSAMKRFWQRTFYGGFEKSIIKICLLCVMFVVLGIVLPAITVTSAITMYAGNSTIYLQILVAITLTTLFATAFVYTIFLKCTQHANWLYAITTPIGLILGAWVTASTLLTILNNKGIRWRGSVYK